MIKAALILDDKSLTRWQKDALEFASDQLDICLVLSCDNTSTKRSYGKHFLYYVVNFFTLRNSRTVRTAYELCGVRVIDFDSIYEGSWQKIPRSVSNELKNHEVEVVIKFGMSLLRIDQSLEQYKILSFHHGDPTYFRGRPAGFYELLQKNGSVGTIVQSISNKVDAGEVWAICHSKAYHHSYKKTAINFYSNSKFLLRKALINLQRGVSIDLLPNGKIYRLPSNYVVTRFLFSIFYRKIIRIFYGTFYEKRWNIVTYTGHDILSPNSLEISEGKSAIIGSAYSFYADPFYSADGECIRLEALNSANGLGDIVELDANSLKLKNVILTGRHYSYPFSFSEKDSEIVVPEVASHSSPYLLRSPFESNNKALLKGLESLRIVDGTVLESGGVYYIFFGLSSSASDCLYLFYSSLLDGDFVSHPLNPIVIDPSRARMAGRVISRDGKYFRFGQNNSFGYGNGVSVCEITKLSPTEYEERVVNTITFDDASGPHTIDMFEAKSVLDYYVDRFSILAWYRRTVPIILRLLN